MSEQDKEKYQVEYERAMMANAIYRSEEEIKRSISTKDDRDDLLPRDWDVLHGSFEDTNAKTGFVAGAFINRNRGEIVIAYRGSEPNHGGIDFKKADAALAKDSDLPIVDGLGLRNKLPEWDRQFDQALTYSDRIIEQAKLEPGGPYKVVATGHSLGASHAQVASEMFGLPGTGFDPGGAVNLVQTQQFKDWAENFNNRYPPWSEERQQAPHYPIGVSKDFTNYMVNDSIVSRHAGPQIGATIDLTGVGGRGAVGNAVEDYRSRPDSILGPSQGQRTVEGILDAASWGADKYFRHGMGRILEEFKKASETGELNKVGALAPDQSRDRGIANTTPVPGEPVPGWDHPLFIQAMGHVQKLGPQVGGYRNDEEKERVAAALALDAQDARMKSIHQIVPSTNGAGLIAVWTNPGNQEDRVRAYADKMEAVNQPLDKTLQQLDNLTHQRTLEQAQTQQQEIQRNQDTPTMGAIKIT